MFKNLLSFWKGKEFLAQVFEEFKDMLDQTECMYKMVCSTLLDNVEEPNLKEKIYEIDKKVNRLQKNIRKRIVEHLSLQPTVGVSACLLLMSVVKDAERLGDYSKNLYEVTELLQKPIDKTVFSQYFGELDKDILTLFRQTKEAFMEADRSKAESSWNDEHRLAIQCDRIVRQLVKSNLSVNEAVCFVLIARHFKRLTAHLVNIATSVILPLSDLDYFDERKHED
ncbi:MAG: PhoU domain-containing protein [Sedimentisphaerales bacterium]|jgi:phosphate uptake regulator